MCAQERNMTSGKYYGTTVISIMQDICCDLENEDLKSWESGERYSKYTFLNQKKKSICFPNNGIFKPLCIIS